MRNAFSFIMIFGLVLAGCRAKRDVSVSQSSTSIGEIGVDLHKADSLWSSIAERLIYKIEFYPLENGSPKPTTESSFPIDPTAASVGLAPQSGVVGGGMGSVKSIEISAEKTEDRSVITATDSVVEQKNANEATLQEDKKTEAKQDNGTVTIIAIVAAVAVLAYVALKHYLR